MPPRPSTSTLFPYTTLFRSRPFLLYGRGWSCRTDVIHRAEAVSGLGGDDHPHHRRTGALRRDKPRSEEHTSELQSHSDLVCRLLPEKKKEHTFHTSGSLHAI